MALGGTGLRSCDGGGRSRATSREAGIGNSGAGFGGELVRGALPGQHLFKHLSAHFAAFRFAGRFSDEALLLALKGGLLHLQTGGAVVGPAQDSQVLVELGQDAQFGIEGLVFGAVPTRQEAGELPRYDGGQLFGEIMVGGGVHGAGVGGEYAGFVEHFPLGLPFEEAALAPFLEILPGDGLASEVRGEHGRDTGDGIEPVEKFSAILIVGEALVEFHAQSERQAGDFSFALHNYVLCYDSL